MAAKKDNGQEPPQSGRRAVIWRLPATKGADESSDAGADPPRRRRAPQPVVWGLVAALVAVGLYAAWSTVGRDIWPTGGETAVAPAPVQAAPAVEGAGGGPEGGAATLQPPGGDEGAPLAAVDVGVEEGVAEDAEPAPSGGARPAVAAGMADEADPSGGAEAAPPAPAPDPQSPAPAASPGDGRANAETAAAEAGIGTGADADARIGARADAAVTPVVVADTGARTGTVDGDGAAARQADAGALGLLAARLAVLEAQSAASAGAGAAVTALAQRVHALEADPVRGQLDHALAEWNEQRAALEAGLVEMRTRLAEADAEAARQAASDGRLMALVLATGELSAALGSSRGFSPALETLGGLTGEDPEIEGTLARLAPFAAGGVTTLDGLRARFPEAANAIVRTALATDDADWIDETVTKLSQLVTIRRTGGALDPGSLDGRLVEAEMALAAGDLARAIAIVEPLTSGATEAAQTTQATSAQVWLRDARARREADDALAALVATVRARIGARWAAAGVTP